VGVAIGFTLALSTEYWIKASDGIANFWGGVVGAGLGSAFAIFGALYVSSRDKAFQLAPVENRVRNGVSSLRLKLWELGIEIDKVQSGIRARYSPERYAETWKTEWQAYLRALLTDYEEHVKTFPDYFALPPAIYDEIQDLHARAMMPLQTVRIIAGRDYPPGDRDLRDALAGIRRAERALDKIVGLVSARSQ